MTIRVSHIVSSLDQDSLSRTVVPLARALSQNSTESSLILLEQSGRTDLTNFDFDGIPSCHVDHRGTMQTAWAIRDVVRKNKSDMIHVHNLIPVAAGTLAAKLSGVPSCVSLWSRSNIKVFGWAWALNRAAVFPSENLRAQIARKNGVRPRQTRLIPQGLLSTNGTGENQTAPLRALLSLEEDDFLIGNTGGLVPDEDQTSLLKAFRKLINKKMKSALLLYGEGPMKELLAKLADNYGVTRQIRFVDRTMIPEADFLSQIDVLVQSTIVPERHESILKGMAAGIPVVATKIGDQTEMITDGQTGYLVPCGFPERIEAAVSRLYVNQNLMKAMGEKAREQFREKYQRERVIQAYRELYRELCQK